MYLTLKTKIRGMALAVPAALMAISGASAQAQTTIPLVNLWDLTGTYEADANGIPFTFDLVQDAKGKITGGSNWQHTDEFGANTSAKLSIKGHIKSQSGGKVAVKLSFMHQGTFREGPGAERGKFRAKQRLLAMIDPVALTVSGRLKTSVQAGENSTENTETLVDLPLDPAMDGTADLVINTSEGPKGHSGTATCTFASGQSVDLRTKGKLKEANGVLRLMLKGHKRDASSGANFKVDISSEDLTTIEFLKGRIMGQKVTLNSIEPPEPPVEEETPPTEP